MDDVMYRSTEPVVSPLALAVSLRVNSSFVADLVPSLQLSVKVSHISCSLMNHSNYAQCGMYVFKIKQAVREAATIFLAPCKLTFDLEVVSKSRLTWATSVSLLVFLGLCSWLRPDVRDRQSDVRQISVTHTSSLNAPYPRGGSIIMCAVKTINSH